MFSLPAVLLVLLGSIFRGHGGGPRVSRSASCSPPGSSAAGSCPPASSTWASPSLPSASRGLLKRLRGTPMPGAAYFIGKTGLVLISTIAETAILDRRRHAGRPSAAAGLRRPLVDLCLGVRARARSRARCSGSPIEQPAPLGAQRHRGHHAPVCGAAVHLRGLRAVHAGAPLAARHGSIFPLKWICQGLRSVFLPAQAAVARARWLLGARPHRAGADGLDRGRAGAVPDHVPVAQRQERPRRRATRYPAEYGNIAGYGSRRPSQAEDQRAGAGLHRVGPGSAGADPGWRPGDQRGEPRMGAAVPRRQDVRPALLRGADRAARPVLLDVGLDRPADPGADRRSPLAGPGDRLPAGRVRWAGSPARFPAGRNR